MKTRLIELTKKFWLVGLIFLSPILSLYISIFTKYWIFIKPFKEYILVPYFLLGVYMILFYCTRHSRLNFEINSSNKDISIKKLKKEFKVSETVICNLNSNSLLSNVLWDEKNERYTINLVKEDSTFGTLIHEFCHIITGQAKKAEKMDDKKVTSKFHNFFTDIFSCYWREIYYLYKWR